MVSVERSGRAFCAPLDRITAKAIRETLVGNISPDATLMTDQLRAYIGVGREFAEHHRVKHNEGQYPKLLPSGIVTHTNTAESFCA